MPRNTPLIVRHVYSRFQRMLRVAFVQYVFWIRRRKFLVRMCSPNNLGEGEWRRFGVRGAGGIALMSSR